ncbi:MAG: response regulator [Halobacteriota archaeon]|nr:response regulator [Halobacteriota archaeon]
MMGEIDKNILGMLEEDNKAPPEQIAERLGIEVSEVKSRLDKMADDRTKILIVDDEIDSLKSLKMALEFEGYAVVEAMNGPSAMDMVHSEHPDLVLLDLMMPVMDGYEVCQKLKEDSMTSHVPVIMLTCVSEVDNKIEGIEVGADDYVTKPFNLSELKARVKMVLRRSAF